jgi:hypothetical protein
MVLAEHLADDAGALLVRRRRAKRQLVHGVQDASLDRLQAVPHVRERASGDDAHRVVEVRLAHLALDRARLDLSCVHTS